MVVIGVKGLAILEKIPKTIGAGGKPDIPIPHFKPPALIPAHRPEDLRLFGAAAHKRKTAPD
jgi:hypothetical protein